MANENRKAIAKSESDDYSGSLIRRELGEMFLELKRRLFGT